MNRVGAVVWPLLVAAWLATSGMTTLASEPATVRIYRHDGMIHGVSARILDSVLDAAAREHDALVILELDTPGGLVDAAESMVKSILASKAPVCVFVGPRGAHAASAGFFLLMAADLAAMAPQTRTGAAHPISLGRANAPDDLALKKAAEDLSALLRTTAAQRGRPAELAEQAVRDARTWTAEEALQAHLIELIAADGTDLLHQLDGRVVVRPDGSRVTLSLAGARVVRHRLSWSRSVANVVLHPMLMALLLAIASLAIYIELTNPGLVLPGVVGVISLLVFLYGSSVLPVNYFAAALLAVGIVLFILEIKVISHGLLSLAGGGCVLIGLYLLFPRGVPGLTLPLGSLLPLAFVLIGLLTVVTVLVARAQRSRVTTGREGLIGQIGVVRGDLQAGGTVELHGESWTARALAPVAAGQAVRVVGHEGLVLIVEPVNHQGP